MTGGVVVVGGGFGALEVALAVRKLDSGIPVTVIAGETEIVYRPQLIRVPSGGPSPPVIPFAHLLATAGAEVLRGRALAVDLEQRHIVLDSGRQIPYDQLVVATGAVADRDRLPGGREHAVFPCDLEDATEFATRVAARPGRVAVVFGWERPGPGLEYAAWIADRRPEVRVTAIDGDGTMARRFGDQATAWVRALFEKRGAHLVTEGAVVRIGEGTVVLPERAIEADLIAIVAPLRGSTDWLPAGLVNERGMLRVDDAMRAAAGVFGIGDVVAVPDGYRLPPALRSILSTAGGVARNVMGALSGAASQGVLKPGQPDMVGPDLSGSALLVRDRRIVLKGRFPLLITAAGERRYLRSRSARRA